MALLERTYAGRLESEQYKTKILEEKLAQVTGSSPGGETTSNGPNSDDLEQKVEFLENEVRLLNKDRMDLKVELEERESAYEYFMSSAKFKIKKLEEGQDATQTGNPPSKSLVEVETSWELDRKKLQSLELSESKMQILLTAERKKSKALETLVEKLKAAMKRMSNKTIQLEEARGEIELLKREMEHKDFMVSSIRQIVSNTEPYASARNGRVMNALKSDSMEGSTTLQELEKGVPVR